MDHTDSRNGLHTLLPAGLLASAVLLATGLALAACSSSAKPAVKATGPACGPNAPKLTVTASGEATATPDLLTMVVGVSSSASTAQDALSGDNTEATGVIDALKAGGVQPGDIQTTNLSINPSYDNHGNIDGYSANNTVIAKVHDSTGQFASAGSLIDAVAAKAGNDIRLNGIGFSVNDTSALEGRARAQAVHTALVHAQDMAAAAGERLGGICSLTDASDTSQAVPNSLSFGNAAASPADMSAAPIQSGTQQVSAQASVIYSLVVPAGPTSSRRK